MMLLSSTFGPVELLYFIFPLFIATMVPLALVALGALFSERSGVINIALEGIMLMGGFVGAIVVKTLETQEFILNIEPEGTRLLVIAFIALFVGALVGIVFSLLHAFASVNMKANQVISGTALNLFAPAFAIFTARMIYGVQQVKYTNSYKIKEVPFLADIPVIGDLFFQGVYLSTLIGIIIFIIAVIILYKTRIGLRLRSCGENPHAADSLGINIYKIRYGGVLTSGALAGMGGVIFILSFAKEFNATVAGFGFLALAVLIFGNWKPGRIILAASFFALMRVLASTHNTVEVAFPFLKNFNITGETYSLLPYLATLIVLALVSKNSAAPKASGEPYDPGKR